VLKEPDPAQPIIKKEHLKKDRLWKRELVRIKHMDNCLTCHPASSSGAELAQGSVPGFAVVDQVLVVPTGSLPASLQLLVANNGAIAQPTAVKNNYPYDPNTSANTVAPFTVRGDVTFLRQDFSIQQSVLVPQPTEFASLRFDYLVRVRPLTDKQTHEWNAQVSRPEGYEQREAVLFALRELTGRDAGLTTEAWEKLYPTSEIEQWTTKLTMALVDAPDHQKLTYIKKLRDAKGAAYTEALAQAIPQLAEAFQPKARAALLERMKRMNQATLRDKLSSDNREIRLAAASAVGVKEESALIPDLTALLDDPEPAVAEAAQAALKALQTRVADSGRKQ
jgi:hypothetical protein